LVQSLTLKIEENHEEALEAIKQLKTAMAGKGVTVRAFWAIEAGSESGTATVALEFPNAAAWAALVDSDDPELREMRRRGVEAHVVVNSSLLQEVDLS
jgi:hypothetical protein